MGLIALLLLRLMYGKLNQYVITEIKNVLTKPAGTKFFAGGLFYCVLNSVFLFVKRGSTVHAGTDEK